jgi:hypothetical protein
VAGAVEESLLAKMGGSAVVLSNPASTCFPALLSSPTDSPSLVPGHASTPILQQFAIPGTLIRWHSHLSTAAGSTWGISPSSPAWASATVGTHPPGPAPARTTTLFRTTDRRPGQLRPHPNFPPPPTPLIKITLAPALDSIFSRPNPRDFHRAVPRSSSKVKLLLPDYCTRHHAVRLKCSTIPSVPGN